MIMKDNERYLKENNFSSKNGVLTAEPDLDSHYVVDLIERSGAIELYGYKNVDTLLDDFMISVEISYDKKSDKTELCLYTLTGDIVDDTDRNHCFIFSEDFLSKEEISDFKEFLLSAEQIQQSLPAVER